MNIQNECDMKPRKPSGETLVIDSELWNAAKKVQIESFNLRLKKKRFTLEIHPFRNPIYADWLRTT